jgi:hypothetical protein
MAALALQPPKLYMPGQGKEPDIFPYGITALAVGAPATGVAPAAGDLTTLDSAGNAQASLGTAAVNWTSAVSGFIIGIAQHGSLDIPYTGQGGNVAITETALFGASPMPANSGDFNDVHVIQGHNGQPFVFSLVEAWAANLVGTTTYIKKDATTGFWVLTTTIGGGGTKAVQITGKVLGVNAIVGTIGDTGSLVYGSFLPAVLAN